MSSADQSSFFDPLPLANFSAYNARWAMPHRQSGGAANMWYSFDIGAAHVVNEMYLKDDLLKLPVVAELPTEYNAALRERIKVLVDTVKEALHDGDATEVVHHISVGGGVFDRRDSSLL